MADIVTHSLVGCPLFRGVAENDLERMLRCFSTRTAEYAKDSIIAQAGESQSSLGVVMSGQAVMTQMQADGRQLDMELLSPGNVFGEVEAFTGEHRFHTVLARKRTTILFMEPCRVVHTCENACPWHHLLIQNMIERLAERTRLLQRQVYYMTIPSLCSRISAYLLEEAERQGNYTFMLDMDRNQLAGYLNMARPSLSRELAHMRDNGWISYYKHTIRIHDSEALHANIDL